jgi:hypothetical protein
VSLVLQLLSASGGATVEYHVGEEKEVAHLRLAMGHLLDRPLFDQPSALISRQFDLRPTATIKHGQYAA